MCMFKLFHSLPDITPHRGHGLSVEILTTRTPIFKPYKFSADFMYRWVMSKDTSRHKSQLDSVLQYFTSLPINGQRNRASDLKYVCHSSVPSSFSEPFAGCEVTSNGKLLFNQYSALCSQNTLAPLAVLLHSRRERTTDTKPLSQGLMHLISPKELFAIFLFAILNQVHMVVTLGARLIIFELRVAPSERFLHYTHGPPLSFSFSSRVSSAKFAH